MSKTKNLYNIRRITNGFNVVKFDDELNYVETYVVQEERGRWFCSCPNTMAPVCRHIKMLQAFAKKKAIDKAVFFCYDTNEWTEVKDA